MWFACIKVNPFCSVYMNECMGVALLLCYNYNAAPIGRSCLTVEDAGASRNRVRCCCNDLAPLARSTA